MPTTAFRTLATTRKCAIIIITALLLFGRVFLLAAVAIEPRLDLVSSSPFFPPSDPIE